MFIGNKKVLINPQYLNLSSFVMDLPNIFEREGEYIHNGRNKIKVFNVDGLKVNVKKYAIPPYFFNRMIYLFIRDPKAVRSYNYALRLQELGVNSPTPIAYFLTKKGVLLSYCYLVTIQLSNVYTLYDIADGEFSVSKEYILEEVGKFTAKLHKLGICHYDYTAGNILFNIVDNKVVFNLIDINRMAFTKVSFLKGCKNFSRLDLNEEMLKIVVYAYAKEQGFNKEETFKVVMANRRKKSKILKRIKRLLIKNS